MPRFIVEMRRESSVYLQVEAETADQAKELANAAPGDYAPVFEEFLQEKAVDACEDDSDTNGVSPWDVVDKFVSEGNK